MMVDVETQSDFRRVSPWVALRAVVWSSLFVGTVAVYLPSLFGFDARAIQLDQPSHLLGLLLMAAGGALAIACIVEFVRSGHGTPMPVDAPRRLVARGPYRIVRNPMYTGVAGVLAGQLVIDWSPAFLGYALTWLLLMHLLVVLYEEPTLQERFGDSYERYTRQVPRWIPRLGKPYDGG
jgi:protein-S-isoprenylcysteine O-methyltransferase Ste14